MSVVRYINSELCLLWIMLITLIVSYIKFHYCVTLVKSIVSYINYVSCESIINYVDYKLC